MSKLRRAQERETKAADEVRRRERYAEERAEVRQIRAESTPSRASERLLTAQGQVRKEGEAKIKAQKRGHDRYLKYGKRGKPALVTLIDANTGEFRRATSEEKLQEAAAFTRRVERLRREEKEIAEGRKKVAIRTDYWQ